MFIFTEMPFFLIPRRQERPNDAHISALTQAHPRTSARTTQSHTQQFNSPTDSSNSIHLHCYTRNRKFHSAMELPESSAPKKKFGKLIGAVVKVFSPHPNSATREKQRDTAITHEAEYTISKLAADFETLKNSDKVRMLKYEESLTLNKEILKVINNVEESLNLKINESASEIQKNLNELFSVADNKSEGSYVRQALTELRRDVNTLLESGVNREVLSELSPNLALELSSGGIENWSSVLGAESSSSEHRLDSMYKRFEVMLCSLGSTSNLVSLYFPSVDITRQFLAPINLQENTFIGANNSRCELLFLNQKNTLVYSLEDQKVTELPTFEHCRATRKLGCFNKIGDVQGFEVFILEFKTQNVQHVDDLQSVGPTLKVHKFDPDEGWKHKDILLDRDHYPMAPMQCGTAFMYIDSYSGNLVVFEDWSPQPFVMETHQLGDDITGGKIYSVLDGLVPCIIVQFGLRTSLYELRRDEKLEKGYELVRTVSLMKDLYTSFWSSGVTLERSSYGKNFIAGFKGECSSLENYESQLDDDTEPEYRFLSGCFANTAEPEHCFCKTTFLVPSNNLICSLFSFKQASVLQENRI